MRIKKKYQGTIPENKILNIKSSSETDTYSCKYINNHSGGQDIYSTEEIKTNKVWIDNKPIYRNIIKATLPTNQERWTMIASNVVSNIDFLVNLYGIYDTTDAKFIFPKGEGIYHINAQIEGTDLYCIRRGWDSIEATFIIEYTKTTD